MALASLPKRFPNTSFCQVEVIAVPNDEGQDGPHIKRVSRGCSGCANGLRVQAVLVIQKQNFSNVDTRAPVSAMTLSSFLHVFQPILNRIRIHAEIEYC
jgi:hypothetical protein